MSLLLYDVNVNKQYINTFTYNMCSAVPIELNLGHGPYKIPNVLLFAASPEKMSDYNQII